MTIQACFFLSKFQKNISDELKVEIMMNIFYILQAILISLQILKVVFNNMYIKDYANNCQMIEEIVKYFPRNTET